MTLSEEQVKYVKEQILKQIESLPQDKKDQIREYVLSMNNEQLEEFLKQNKMMAEQEESENNSENSNQKSGKTPECIMCLLSSKKIESMTIFEDKDYLAALEINPFSKGQVILIPKEHIKETKAMKSKAFTLANKIGKYLVKKLNAADFQITSSDELKHAIINIIPRYKDQKLTFERKPAKKEELQELFKVIGKIEKKPKIQKIKTEKAEVKEVKDNPNIIKMSRRIP